MPTILYLDNSKSASEHDVFSDMQPMNSFPSLVECDGPTFSIVQEWKYAHRYKEGYDLPDDQYKAWLKVTHPEDTRAGNVSDFQWQVS